MRYARMTIFWKLEWLSDDGQNDGLWQNEGRIAVHLPQFRAEFKGRVRADSFHVSYDEGKTIRPMRLHFFRLNDLVFYDDAWSESLRRATVYTTLVPRA